jgi:hypothetical protein
MAAQPYLTPIIGCGTSRFLSGINGRSGDVDPQVRVAPTLRFGDRAGAPERIVFQHEPAIGPVYSSERSCQGAGAMKGSYCIKRCPPKGMVTKKAVLALRRDQCLKNHRSY